MGFRMRAATRLRKSNYGSKLYLKQVGSCNGIFCSSLSMYRRGSGIIPNYTTNDRTQGKTLIVRVSGLDTDGHCLIAKTVRKKILQIFYHILTDIM